MNNKEQVLVNLGHSEDEIPLNTTQNESFWSAKKSSERARCESTVHKKYMK